MPNNDDLKQAYLDLFKKELTEEELDSITGGQDYNDPSVIQLAERCRTNYSNDFPQWKKVFDKLTVPQLIEIFSVSCLIAKGNPEYKKRIKDKLIEFGYGVYVAELGDLCY